MKSLSLFATLILLVALLGCDHVTSSNNTENVETLSINSSEVFEYQTGITGDEESAMITQQPAHHEISEIVRNSRTNWEAVYRYKAENGFRGTDRVELKLGTGSDGSNSNNHFKYVTIEFNVE